MITTEGAKAVVEFFAQQRANIVTHLAVGVGTALPTVSDTELSLEVVRLPLVSVSADLVNSKVIYIAELPPGNVKTIYEVGAWTDDANDSGRMLSTTDSTTANWSNATISPDNARVGTQTVKVDYTGSGTTTAELLTLTEDFSAYDNDTTVTIAFYATANLSSLRVRLGTDDLNYFQFVVSSPVNGAYNIHKFLKTDVEVVGTPDWSTINYMAVRPSATSSGPGSVYFDAIKFEDSEGVLVSRSVLSAPLDVDPNLTSRIEYALPVTVTSI